MPSLPQMLGQHQARTILSNLNYSFNSLFLTFFALALVSTGLICTQNWINCCKTRKVLQSKTGVPGFYSPTPPLTLNPNARNTLPHQARITPTRILLPLWNMRVIIVWLGTKHRQVSYLSRCTSRPLKCDTRGTSSRRPWNKNKEVTAGSQLRRVAVFRTSNRPSRNSVWNPT